MANPKPIRSYQAIDPTWPRVPKEQPSKLSFSLPTGKEVHIAWTSPLISIWEQTKLLIKQDDATQDSWKAFGNWDPKNCEKTDLLPQVHHQFLPALKDLGVPL